MVLNIIGFFFYQNPLYVILVYECFHRTIQHHLANHLTEVLFETHSSYRKDILFVPLSQNDEEEDDASELTA